MLCVSRGVVVCIGHGGNSSGVFQSFSPACFVLYNLPYATMHIQHQSIHLQRTGYVESKKIQSHPSCKVRINISITISIQALPTHLPIFPTSVTYTYPSIHLPTYIALRIRVASIISLHRSASSPSKERPSFATMNVNLDSQYEPELATEHNIHPPH